MTDEKPVQLAPLVEYYWRQDGCPLLLDRDMLKRAVEADEELEREGNNPAEEFRECRKRFDDYAMLDYVRRGWHEYPFHPNYKKRNNTAT